MEIIIKVLTFSGIFGAMVLIAGIVTEILMKRYPQIVRKILGEN